MEEIDSIGVLALVLGLVSPAVTIAGAWFAFARRVPTRGEVHRMIAAESPYVKDQGTIRLALEHLTLATKAHGELCTRLVERIEALEIGQARLGEKLDHLIQINGRRRGKPEGH